MWEPSTPEKDPERVARGMESAGGIVHRVAARFALFRQWSMSSGSVSRLYMNFGRPHESHAKPYPTTPAMAAGLADHIWMCEEIAALLD